MAKLIIDTSKLAGEIYDYSEHKKGEYVLQCLRAATQNKEYPCWLTPYEEKKKRGMNAKGPYSRMFDQFWKSYPARSGVKQGKRPAFGAWVKHFTNEIGEAMLLKECVAALEWQVRTEDWKKEKGAYIPMASTYLNQERWTDEIPTDLPPAEKRTNSEGFVIET